MSENQHRRANDMECGATSREVPGFGFLYCELRPNHDGPHREREDGHVWDEDIRS